MSLRGKPALALRVTFLVVLLAGLGAGIVAVRRLVDARMAQVRDSLLSYLQTKLGRTITYGEVSPSVFRQLAITDLRIYSATDPSRVVLSVDRISATYSLLRLLLTRDALQALRQIDLSGSVLTLDYQADSEIFKALAGLVQQENGSGRTFAIPKTLRVTGSELEVHFLSPEAQIGISRLFFSVSGSDKWLTVSLRCGLSAQLSIPGPLAGEVQARVSVSGKTALDLSWADCELQLRSVTHDKLALRDQTFLFSFRDGVVTLTKIEDRAPVDLELTIGTESKTARVTFRTDSLHAADLLSLRGDWQQYEAWLANTVTARGSASMNLDGSGLTYDVEIQTVLSHPSLPAPFSIDARVSGDTSTAAIQSLTATSTLGSLTFSGDLDLHSWLPQGQAHVEGLEGLIGRRVAGDLSIQRSLGTGGQPRHLRLTSAAFDVGPLALRNIEAELDLGSGQAEVTARAEAVGASPAERPRATLAGTVSWKPKLAIDVSGEVGTVSLGTVLASLTKVQEKALGPMIPRLLASSPVHLTTDLKSYSVELGALSMWDPQEPTTRATGSLLLQNGRITATSMEVSYLGQTLTGDATLQLEGARAVGFEGAVTLNDVPFDVAGSLDASDLLHFTGSYGIEGSVGFFARDMYFSAKSRDMPVPLGGFPLSASLNLRGVFPDGEEWFITSEGSTASFQVPGANAKLNAKADFSLDHAGVTFDSLTLQDPISTITGSGTVSFVDLAKLSVALDLDLGDKATKEHYRVTGTVSREALNLQATLSGSPVSRLGQKVVSGSFRGTATVSGSPAAPKVTARNLTLENGHFNRDPVTLSGDLVLSAGYLELGNVRLTLRDHKVVDGRAAFDMKAGTFSVGGLYDALLLRDQVHTKVGMSGTFKDYRFADIAALSFPTTMDATLTVSEATVDTVPFPPWSVEFRARGDTLSFSGGPSGMLKGSLGRDHHVSATIREPFPIVGSVEGTYEGSEIDVKLAVERFDVPVLGTLVRSDIIKFLGGTASGNVTIYGPLNNPDIVGSVRVTDGMIGSPMSPDVAGPFNTYVSFGPGKTDEAGEEQKGFDLGADAVVMGKGKISAAARFTLDHWSPSAFDLRLTAEPAQGVHIVWHFGTLAVDGYVRGTVRVLNDETGTKVSSDNLVVQPSKLWMDWSNVSGEEDGGEPYPLGVDVKVTTGRNVQFIWPSALPILKATARQGSSVLINYDGLNGELIMDGDVEVLGGDLFFFDRSFSIRQGSISFHEDKFQFDPRVSLHAEIRERDANNRDIRIYLDADRVRLSELSTQTIRFSSDPALSSAEILARIGQSISLRTGSAGGETGTAALPLVASLTGDVISRVGLLSPVEDKIRELLGLDLLSIRTQLVQNFLVDKLLSQGPLDNNIPALGKYLSNTELTVGRYIGDDIFLEMMVRLQTADGGEKSGFAGLTGLSPAFEISLEWETPIPGFTLDWSFVPQHPETLFLSDNTIGFRWRHSY